MLRGRPRSRAARSTPASPARAGTAMTHAASSATARSATCCWQALARLAWSPWSVFFVRNASDNMAKAGIASGFDFLWRDSGIEVPFILTGYKPQSTPSWRCCGSASSTRCWSRCLGRRWRRCSASPSACCGCRATGCCRPWPAPTSSSCATSRCCSSCCSGTSACIAALPAPRQSSSFFGVAFLNSRGLSIPLPNDVRGFRLAAARDPRRCSSCRSGFARWARGAAGAHRPRLPDLDWSASLLLRRCCRSLAFVARGALDRAGTCRRCAASTIAAASCWCRSSWRCSPRSSTYTAGFIAEVVRGGILSVRAGPDRRRARRSASRPAGSCGWS